MDENQVLAQMVCSIQIRQARVPSTLVRMRQRLLHNVARQDGSPKSIMQSRGYLAMITHSRRCVHAMLLTAVFMCLTRTRTTAICVQYCAHMSVKRVSASVNKTYFAYHQKVYMQVGIG